MIQDLYQAALKFAGHKHRDQQVPGTKSSYVVHLSNVAMEVLLAHAHRSDFDLGFAVQLALLHDTIEDTDTTFAELSARFGERVAKGVQALTKDDTLPTKEARMIDSLARINLLEKEVGMVKLADRITNLQPPPRHWNSGKIARYQAEAKLIAERLNGKNAFLENRLEQKIEEYGQYLPG